jgi:hypothetical protein
VRVVFPALTISPSAATVAAGAAETFTASGGSGTGYQWNFAVNASGASMSPSGVYVAGRTSGVTDTVRVTDSVGTATTASVTVTAAPAGGCTATGGVALPTLVCALLPLAWRRRRR